MIKQSVCYGVWVINRDEDNKIEILKNGQVCAKSTPALREIAAEIGLEVDPEWRTSQLGRNVIKAIQSKVEGGVEISTDVNHNNETSIRVEESQVYKKLEQENKELSQRYIALQEEIKEYKKTALLGIIEGLKNKEVKRKYDVNSIENSKDFCENNPDLKAFHNGWIDMSKSQFEKLLKQAEAGDAIAQYKCGYIIGELFRSKMTLEKDDLSEDSREMYTKYYNAASKLVDEKSIEDKTYWLEESAKQGLGLAIKKLVDFYLYGPIRWASGALEWNEEYNKVCPWFGTKGLYYAINTVNDIYRKYPSVSRLCNKNNEKYFQERKKNETLLKEYDELKQKYNNVIDDYNKLVRDYKELEQKAINDRKDYNRLVDKVNEKLSSSSSSRSTSSSSSRSVGYGDVRVRIKFDTDSTMWTILKGGAKIITMPEDEYKSLLRGSMKARVAFVRDKFNVPSSIAVFDVTISLA